MHDILLFFFSVWGVYVDVPRDHLDEQNEKSRDQHLCVAHPRCITMKPTYLHTAKTT